MNWGHALAATGIAAVLVISACGDEPRTVSLVRLVPEANPDCGAPSDARTLRIAAIGDFSATDNTARSVEIAIGESLSIEDFPRQTRALEVEVLGSGGSLRTVGRTEEFDGGALAGGEEIAVFMAPPDGACATGPPARARSGAIVAVTGDSVVVVGGVDAVGTPVSRPEVYLSREARFVEIAQDLYGDVEDGLVGASLTTLSDGRIALVGGGQNAFQVYTPEAGSFSEPPLLLQQARAFHAAVALDDEQIFLAGGCTMVEDGACAEGTETATTAILRVTTGELVLGPSLMFVRVGAKAFLEPDGRVIVVGGSFAGAPVLSAERIDPQNREPTETLSGTGQVGVRLASGAIVTAFGPIESPSGEGTAFAPGGTSGAALVTAPSRGDPTLTALESGRVLAFGGAGGDALSSSEAALFAPIAGRWSELETLPSLERRRHASALLPDGTVLVVGGERASGEHLGDALVFRPDLLGPLTGGLTINFADETAEQLVGRDRAALDIVPASGELPAFLAISARATDEGVPGEWAIAAAPILGRSVIELTTSGEGGFAILTGFQEPTTYRVTLVSPGVPVSVLDITAGSVQPVPGCVGDSVPASDFSTAQRWTQQTTDERIVLEREETPVLDCTAVPARSGRVGVGALGETGSDLRLFQLTIRR